MEGAAVTLKVDTTCFRGSTLTGGFVVFSVFLFLLFLLPFPNCFDKASSSSSSSSLLSGEKSEGTSSYVPRFRKPLFLVLLLLSSFVVLVVLFFAAGIFFSSNLGRFKALLVFGLSSAFFKAVVALVIVVGPGTPFFVVSLDFEGIVVAVVAVETCFAEAALMFVAIAVFGCGLCWLGAIIIGAGTALCCGTRMGLEASVGF